MIYLARFGEMIKSLENLAWDCERGNGGEQVGISLRPLRPPPPSKAISDAERLMLQWGTWEELVLNFWLEEWIGPSDPFPPLGNVSGFRSQQAHHIFFSHPSSLLHPLFGTVQTRPQLGFNWHWACTPVTDCALFLTLHPPMFCCVLFVMILF